MLAMLVEAWWADRAKPLGAAVLGLPACRRRRLTVGGKSRSGRDQSRETVGSMAIPGRREGIVVLVSSGDVLGTARSRGEETPV